MNTPAPSACASARAERKARRRARRERRAEAARAATEVALARICPRCGARPGVWCGATQLGPWMHETRYPATPERSPR